MIERNKNLQRYGLLSVIGSIVILAMKAAAWWVSRSVGIFSDAAESLVNVTAAATTVLLLRWASEPEDNKHPFGHDKAEHVAATFEGVLLTIASITMVVAAIDRLAKPVKLASLDVGLVLTTLATVFNGAIGYALVRAGKLYDSDALSADGHHLLSDVYSSVALVVGLVIVRITSISWLDPLLAALIAIVVARTGIKIISQAAAGILDESLPPNELEKIKEVLNKYEREEKLAFHALRTRRSGQRRFIELHLLVPGDWTVKVGHDVCDRVEKELESLFPVTTARTHLEPINERVSNTDVALTRHTHSD